MSPAKKTPLPAGYMLIPVRTTYLEMKTRPDTEPILIPHGCTMRRWRRPSLKGYRRLFSAVGGKWGWSGRLIMDDDELTTTIRAETNEIFQLKWNSEPAGFSELDRSDPARTEITYLGLVPRFIGRGLGKYLLDWAIHHAWEGRPQRVWLHTCQYDHPGALAVYLKAGFAVFDEKVEMQPYPEDFLKKRSPGDG